MTTNIESRACCCLSVFIVVTFRQIFRCKTYNTNIFLETDFGYVLSDYQDVCVCYFLYITCIYNLYSITM